MSNKKKIYLASPYGFSKQWKSKLLPDFINQLEALGLEVWEPFGRSEQIDKTKAGWANKIARADLDDVKNCDAVFAVINGTPPDEGVMIELGVAIGLNKPIFLFRDDFRLCTDCEDYPLNLMIFCSLPSECWRDFYYTDLSEINSPNKALVKWVEGEG
jgi:nucleoside 2-deoxyribosyltransferase